MVVNQKRENTSIRCTKRVVGWHGLEVNQQNVSERTEGGGGSVKENLFNVHVGST